MKDVSSGPGGRYVVFDVDSSQGHPYPDLIIFSSFFNSSSLCKSSTARLLVID